MSSTVLARKYRPKIFETLVGQGHVVQALSNALTQRRLHHAYLFTGTRGVGKTTIARILAKSLNCTGPDGTGDITARPCGVCAACRDIDAGRFIDYVELDAASNRGVDEITRLLDQAVYKPVVGRFKVYLIDEVHMLSGHAFNAMLKTLEEPPDYLKFVLATTDPQKVPPTVLSRCLQFNLRPMAPETIVEHLGTVLTAEAVLFDSAALKLIARAARGSMRDAESLADQAIAYGAGRIEEGGVRQMLGVVDRGHAVRLVEALAGQDGAAVLAAVDHLRELGLSASGTLEEMARLLQHMAVLQAVPDALDPDDPDAREPVRLAGLMAADETQLLYSIVLHGRAEIGLAPDEYSGLVMVLLRMLAFPAAGAKTVAPASPAPLAQAQQPAATEPVAARAAPLAASTAARASVGEPPPSIDHATADAPADARASTAADAAAGDRWFALVQRLIAAGAVSAMVRELAMQAQCLAVVDGESEQVWRLRVERENLRAPALRERLQAAIAQGAERPARLEIETGAAADSPALREAAERNRRQAEAERIIHDDPLVKALMAQYKTARIVPGSIKPH
ncbi:MAG TPA: DNA polymerase III subunit gamma/tau [Caldimonas sp.]|jgi:DNA polymerase-3 subunit gamma/tau|nr:DNA polymerase III subunit gamma/tau [Caldimonas sp.]HEX2541761.1 DNA polymerase III subunit gamma/tau [Caldimonas sp.]